MLCLSECLTDDAKILLIGKKRFSLLKKEENPIIFRKNFNHAEFIGEEICSLKKIPCVHFFLVADGMFSSNQMTTYRICKKISSNIDIGSYDFRKKDYEYLIIVHGSIDDDCLAPLLEMAPNDQNREELLNEILDMFALDTYMGQIDRFHKNIIFERNPQTKEIHLAPLFDFEYSLKSSYLDVNSIYLNPIYPFYTLKDCKKIIHEFPLFKEKLESYLDIQLVDIASYSYQAKGLIMPSCKLPFYQEFDKRQKRLIRKIIE